MTATRILQALCLLLLLSSGTPLIATATADTGKQRQAQPPTLLWQTFPLRERATHQLGPKLHHEAPIAHKANSESPVPATQATKTFPGAVIIGLLAVTMLAAVALFIARRPVGHPAAGPRENERINAEARAADAIVAADRAQTVTKSIDAATSPTKQEPATRLSASQPARYSEPVTKTPRANVQPIRGNSKPEREVAAERPGEQRVGIERCEIVLWTGYVKKQLYAAPLGAARTLEGLATSSYFRLRDADVPNAAAEHALEGLIAQLENAGWQVVSREADWYHYLLERLPCADTESKSGTRASTPRSSASLDVRDQ